MFLFSRSLVFALLSLLLMDSCTAEKEEKQAPLSKDEMVRVMMEIYLAEARLSVLPVDRDSAYRLFIPFQDSLLYHRGIKDSTLRSAYDYYLNRPDELEQIYDQLIDSLSLREQRRRGHPDPR